MNMEDLNKNGVKLYQGSNMNNFKYLPDNSIDSVVTDGPYGLSFMNKKWDYDVPSVEFWKEVYRVLKPGGHVLSFGGTRTYHRMVVNMEDAGFEIRDQIMWLYGSGFPKSHNIGKAVDKLQGNKREVVGEVKQPRMNNDFGKGNHNEREVKELDITKGNSPWEGWGTALKPANEPICLARKPLSEKTIAKNVLKWGTGGLNIDGCRIGSENNEHHRPPVKGKYYGHFNNGNEKEWKPTNSDLGRFPANIILECICDEVIKGEKGEVKKTNRDRKYEVGDDKFGITKDKSVEGIDNYNDKGDIHTNPNCPCRLMDEQSGVSKSSKITQPLLDITGGSYNKAKGNTDTITERGHNDKGGASRYFYQAKVSKKERNMGLDHFEEKKKEYETTTRTNKETADKFGCERKGTAKNTHPTIKPVNLMAYLCRLITPPGGIVLDPFMGSGSTGIAARLEGFRFIGMEMDEDYLKIAEVRINDYENYRQFLK